MKKITVLALLLACSAASWAGDKNSAWNKYLHGYEYQARVAYNLGGTAPIGMPATIRTLHSYTLRNPGKIMFCMVSHQIPGAVNYTKKRLAQSLLRFSNLLHKAFRDFMYYEILRMI